MLRDCLACGQAFIVPVKWQQGELRPTTVKRCARCRERLTVKARPAVQWVTVGRHDP